MTKRRILIVDDEEAFSRLIQLNLEGTGRYEVQVVNQGGKAVAAAEAFRPDLILLDVVMPDMDGGEVARRFESHAWLGRVPIVFLTAIVSRQEVQGTGAVIGQRRFLPKPLSVDELIHGIEQQLAA